MTATVDVISGGWVGTDENVNSMLYAWQHEYGCDPLMKDFSELEI